MQNKHWKIFEQFWILNDLALITFVYPENLEKYLLDNPIKSFLSKKEKDEYKAICWPKRKQEWLIGRLAAKLSIRSWFKKGYAKNISLSEIELFSISRGKPLLKIKGRFIRTIGFSISHSDNIAVAGISVKRNIKIGIDIEKIKKIDKRVYRVFLSENEQRAIKKKFWNRCSNNNTLDFKRSNA